LGEVVGVGCPERCALPDCLVVGEDWEDAGSVRQTPTGTWLVATNKDRAVAYCRVLACDQRDDLERQAGRVAAEFGRRTILLSNVVCEIGSGLDGHRVKLRKLLSDPLVTTIVVEHRDRLARFGVDYLEAALTATGRRIVVLNPEEVNAGAVRPRLPDHSGQTITDVQVTGQACHPAAPPPGLRGL
jgi:Resolvase, N terminal domain